MFGKIKELMSGGAKRLTGKTDLLEGVTAAIVLVGAADGDFSDDEAAIGLDRLMNHPIISKAFTATQIENEFNKQAKRAGQGLTGRLALRKEIEEVTAKSTEDEREILLAIAIDVASADGDIGPKEMSALKTIAQAVSLNLNTYLE